MLYLLNYISWKPFCIFLQPNVSYTTRSDVSFYIFPFLYEARQYIFLFDPRELNITFMAEKYIKKNRVQNEFGKKNFFLGNLMVIRVKSMKQK